MPTSGDDDGDRHDGAAGNPSRTRDEVAPSTLPEPAANATPITTRSEHGKIAPSRSSSTEVDGFVEKMKTLLQRTGTRTGRLIFAMDATMSRQPTWDLALAQQAAMFDAVAALGGLDVQLVFFRGFGECRASRWVGDARALAAMMRRVNCAGGLTQIGKVLLHARREAEACKVDAVVYVGDCMEEAIDELCQRAGELALLGVPMFMFQEGSNPQARTAFTEIARLTHGAYCPFDAGSGEQLRALLSAVAVYASGGRRALVQLADASAHGGARRLLTSLDRGGRSQ